MKTFSDRWRQLDWDDIRLQNINGKTAADVERALNASQSPATTGCHGIAITRRQWLSGTILPSERNV